MANEEAAPKPAAPAPGKKKKLMLIGGIVFALLVAGGGGYYFIAHRGNATEDASTEGDAKPETKKSASAKSSEGGAKKGAKKAEPLYLPLDPPFVVNFQEEGNFRFLQVGVQVMAYQQTTLDAVKLSEPAVRNALVMLFSSQTYSTLVSREGKDKLRQDALAEVQKAASPRLGTATVDDLYFTSFVMQ